MAFSVAQMYPGAFTADVNFVDGKYKNSSAPGVYDGTPLDNLLFNQNLALFDALMLEANLTYNNSADIPSTSQLHKAMQIGREVSPRNNDWNGYLDPEHQSSLPAPNGYPGASGGGEVVYAADEEISFGIFAGSGGATVSSDSDGWIFTGSIYKLYDYTTEQLADIDVTKVPVYLKNQVGAESFVNDSTVGVNVTKVGSQLKVEITAAIFAGSFTKLWRWFNTEKVGYVVELSPTELIRLIGKPVLLASGTFINGNVIPFARSLSEFDDFYVEVETTGGYPSTAVTKSDSRVDSALSVGSVGLFSVTTSGSSLTRVSLHSITDISATVSIVSSGWTSSVKAIYGVVL